MDKSKVLISLIIAWFAIFIHHESRACSMYKLTIGGKTMVGCNEDAWRTESFIWFETGAEGEYGACYTGSRNIGKNNYAAQSGMNEHGLVYSRLASYFPLRPNSDKSIRKTISNPDDFLKQILHKCKDTDDVYTYMKQFDHSLFIDDVFIFVDKSGQYLIVEPYSMEIGNESTYVLSNFCPSITEEDQRRNLGRYRRGVDFLSNGVDTSLQFCTFVSDTMHVCRNRNGDGTLLTSIWDTKKALVNLYFYHDFDTTIQFNIANELAKGDHMFDITSLFPESAEFKRLVEYKTPFNKPFLRVLLVFTGGILTVFSLFYTFIFIRNRKAAYANGILIVVSFLNLLLTAYYFILSTNISIYYFDAPYEHYGSNLISLSSFIPFLLVFSIISLVYYGVNYIKFATKNTWIISLFVLNSLIYVASIIGFGYWGLFDVLS